MRIWFCARCRTISVGAMMIAGAIAMGASGAVAQDAAPSVVSGAGHDIVMRMSVPTTCRMTSSASHIRLTGTADDGSRIDATLSGQAGLLVDCNTPYAMTLARSPVYASPFRHLAPRRPGHTDGAALAHKAIATATRLVASQESDRAARDAAFVDDSIERGVVARAENDGAADGLAGHMEVLVRVDGRGGAMESNCVLAPGVASPFVCHAFAGPDDARLPPPRASASLIVTGAVAAREEDHRTYDGAAMLVGGMLAGARVEHAAIRAAREQALERRIGDRLTVTLSARY